MANFSNFSLGNLKIKFFGVIPIKPKPFHAILIPASVKVQYTGAWSGTDTSANCNKVEHDKI